MTEAKMSTKTLRVFFGSASDDGDLNETEGLAERLAARIGFSEAYETSWVDGSPKEIMSNARYREAIAVLFTGDGFGLCLIPEAVVMARLA
jgi:hypothetical protein